MKSWLDILEPFYHPNPASWTQSEMLLLLLLLLLLHSFCCCTVTLLLLWRFCYSVPRSCRSAVFELYCCCSGSVAVLLLCFSVCCSLPGSFMHGRQQFEFPRCSVVLDVYILAACQDSVCTSYSCLSVCLSVCRSVCLSVSLSLSLSPFVCMCVYVFVCLTVVSIMN